MGRSWTAQLSYRRSFGYYNGYDGLALTDTATAGIGGLVNRRTDFSAGVSYTNADLGLTGNSNSSWWTASSQIRIAMTEKFAAYANYYYYLSDTQGVQIPGLLLERWERQGVRVGLTAWLPLLNSRGVR